MNEEPLIRVLCVDDHPLMQEGIAAVVNGQPDMAMVSQASTGMEGVKRYHEDRPDVVLMDLRMPDISGIDALIAIRAHDPRARVLMLTTFEGDVDVQRSLEAGASGYLLKSMTPDEITGAIRTVHAGRKRIPPGIAAQVAEHLGEESLTGREVEVLRLVAEGNRNQDIAERLRISVETVKVHIKHSMEKLGARDRTQAITIAVRRGFLQL